MRIPDLSGIHAKIAKDANLPNEVWCRTCGARQEIDPAYCLAHGWPKCEKCGYTMTIDKPTETSVDE